MPVENWSDTVAVVHLSDEPQFTEDMIALDSALKQRKRDVLIDMSGVHYVNSSNIARLLRLRKHMITHDSRLVLCGMINQVWGAFMITGLDKIFEFTEDVPTGLATLQLAKGRRE